MTTADATAGHVRHVELATSNSQGELSPLEIGLHCLKAVPKEQGKKGGGLQKYATQLGKDRGNVSRYREAAEVYLAVAASCNDTRGFLDKAQHLAAIHRARRSAGRRWRTRYGGTDHDDQDHVDHPQA